MAKGSKRNYAEESRSKNTKTYPSRFGSHASMVDDEKTKEYYDSGSMNAFREAVKNGEAAILRSDVDNTTQLVVCTDEFGDYVTERSRLDTGLADPNRYKKERLGKLLSTAVIKENNN